VAAGVILAAACNEPEPEPEPELRESSAISDPYLWTQTPPALDPFVARRSGEIVCDPVLGFSPELFGGVPSFEVDTGWCNFVTVQQLAAADLQEGDRLRIRVWHGELTAPEPAEGYVGIALGDEIVWDQSEAIPGPSTPIDAEIELTKAYPEDVDVYFHVDNHGLNTWALLILERDPYETVATAP